MASHLEQPPVEPGPDLFATPRYVQPPVVVNADGDVRRLGIEVELAGLNVPDLAALVAGALDGAVSKDASDTVAEIDTPLGTFRVEVDSAILKDRSYLEPLKALGLEDARLVSQIEGSVLSVASELVPVEVVTPPIPWNLMHQVDELWADVRRHGGQGTRAAYRFAFGLHLNPEFPGAITSESVLAHLQAFFLLEDWLARAEEVDWARKVTPFIDSFDESYRRKCLAPDYAPDLDELIADYLEASPTRNRILDMLPLFVHVKPNCLDGVEVKGANLVNARPTFHYRLPNSDLDRHTWSPASAWANWVEVERLAANTPRRRAMAEAYCQLRDLPWRLQRREWLGAIDDAWMVGKA